MLALRNFCKTPRTSYSNPLGSGDRRSQITYSHSGAYASNYAVLASGQGLINGSTNSITGGYVIGAVSSSSWMKFEFPTPKVIQEVTFIQDPNSGNHGTHRWQGSNDNVNFVNLGGTFTFAFGTLIINTMSSNTTEYKYYRLIGVSGSFSSAPYFIEVNFKIT